MHNTAPLQHCHARAKQSGNRQCRNAPMRGQQVCRMHGGKQPAALANAEDRMRSLVHPAVTALANLIADNDLAAARYVLDYAGFKATEKLEQHGDTTIRVEYSDTPSKLRELELEHRNGTT